MYGYVARSLILNYIYLLQGYDDRRPHRDRSWEGRSGSMDRERGYIHPHKDWDNDDYRPGGGGGGDWGRDRHWGMHEPQVILYRLNKNIIVVIASL